MRKKVITVGLFLVGILVVGSGAKVLSVESSETVTVITPDTPEEKSYYVKNKEALFRQKQLLKSYKIQYYTLQVQKLEFQEIYLQSLYEEIERKIQIETGKLTLGYSTEIVVKELKNQLNEAKMEMENIQARRELCEETVQIYGGVYQPVEVKQELVDLQEDYVSKFLENNVQIKYYDNQIQTYEKFVKNYMDGEDYRIQRDLAELDKQQYIADLQIYVKEKVLQYETIFDEIVQVNYELMLVEEKLNTNRVLYENGKITEIEIIELETEKARLTSEKMGLIFDGYCIHYILEQRIEGV